MAAQDSRLRRSRVSDTHAESKPPKRLMSCPSRIQTRPDVPQYEKLPLSARYLHVS
jgi:hypothetical protein